MTNANFRIFNQSAGAMPVTSPTSLFGGKTSDGLVAQQSPGTNIFGSKSVESASVSFGSFGLSSSPAVSAASPPASTGNIFGTPVAAKPAQNIFGGVATPNSNTSTASVFGGATQTSPSNSFTASPFGNANANNTSGIFGGSGTATSSMQFFT